MWEAIGRRALIIVSGGRGADEQVSEAAAMRAYLVEKYGVPANAAAIFNLAE
ncbi:MAG: ElyC/SanA/YdcF family protein [Gordonibacter sp.]|uniref:ElyC/SanA/YdcF family protein n=1 Tax=Gordonibacter sp. TaxID=1968902 RepID=UPI002FCB03CE